jgi:hypothetical protein
MAERFLLWILAKNYPLIVGKRLMEFFIIGIKLKIGISIIIMIVKK